MTRLDWWIGVLLLVLVLLAHAAIPRYDWRGPEAGVYMIRIDRWTGHVEIRRMGQP